MTEIFSHIWPVFEHRSESGTSKVVGGPIYGRMMHSLHLSRTCKMPGLRLKMWYTTET